MPIVTKKSYRLANGNTKYDNHGGGQAMLSPKDHGTRCDRFIMHIEHKLDLTRPDEITEKNTNKGYNRTPRIF